MVRQAHETLREEHGVAAPMQDTPEVASQNSENVRHNSAEAADQFSVQSAAKPIASNYEWRRERGYLPWQMTRQAYAKFLDKDKDLRDRAVRIKENPLGEWGVNAMDAERHMLRGHMLREHYHDVKRALEYGEPVSQEVLNDYPDLAANGKGIDVVSSMTSPERSLKKARELRKQMEASRSEGQQLGTKPNSPHPPLPVQGQTHSAADFPKLSDHADETPEFEPAENTAPSGKIKKKPKAKEQNKLGPLGLRVGDKIRLFEDIMYARAGQIFEVESLEKREVYISNGRGRTSIPYRLLEDRFERIEETQKPGNNSDHVDETPEKESGEKSGDWSRHDDQRIVVLRAVESIIPNAQRFERAFGRGQWEDYTKKLIAGHDYLKGFAKDNVIGEMAKIKIALSKAKSSADLAAVVDKLKRMAPVSEDPGNPLHRDAASSAENEGGIKFSRSTKNTHPKTFVSSPDGSLDFGEITQDISTTIGRQPAKIRLRHGDEKEGLVHIELRHQADIEALGFDSTIDFINEITRNFTRIYKSDKPNSRSLILVEDKGKLKFAAIQLEPSEDGEFYEIKNATPGRGDQFKNKKPLWERAGPSASSDKQTLLIPEAKADEASITDTDQNTSLSSKTDQPVSGSTVADVKSWLPKRVKRLLDAGKLKVVQSVNDLPAYLQERGTALYHATWHGTPHNFDRFSLEHIGKGEGAQAFGYGLYFADNKKIAEYYRKGLSARDFIDLARDSYDEYSAPDEAVDAMLANPDLSDAQKELLIALQNDDWLGFDYPHQAISAALKHPDNYDLSDETRHALAKQGRLYQVELAPEQDEYLLWDKPLSEQSEKVKSALKKSGYWPKNPEGKNGSDVVVTGTTFEAEDRAYQYHKAGIRGIKYLDRDSRHRGEGSFNYVLFSDEDVSITAKYSQLSGVEALYDERRDQMYLVADMLNQDNLQSVLAHELLHRAEAVDSDLKFALNLFEDMLERSFRLAAARRGSAVEQAAYRRVMDAKTPIDDRPAEYRAYLVSEYSQRPDSFVGVIKKAFEDFVAAIRVALIRSGLDMGFIRSLTPADLAAMSRYGAKVASSKVASSNVKQSGENGKADRMASRSQTTREAYEKRIDELFANPKNIDRNSLREIKMLDRGDVLDLIGFGDLPVYVHEAHAVDDGHYNHSLTAEQWKKIPEWLENPNLVLERQSDGHLTIIAPEKSADGKAIIVALEPQAESKGRTEAKNRHLVLTAYAKDRGVMPVDKYIESGHYKPLYVNQKISPKFYLGSGVQFASEPGKIRAWNRSLKTERDLVKYRKPPDSDKSSSGIKFSRASTGKNGVNNTGYRQWLSDENKKLADTAIYNLQNRFIDLKRQMEKVVKTGGTFTENQDPYQAEELYHQRSASRLKDFRDNELLPILQGLHEKRIGLEEFQKFLHARHAPSRNRVMAERNPNQAIIDQKLQEAEDTLEALRKNPATPTKELQAALREVNKWSRAKPFQGTEEERLSLSGMSDKDASPDISPSEAKAPN